MSFGSLISRGGAVVGGKIKIGDDAVSPSAGAIRWTGSDFEGYNGTKWQSFTQDTQGGGGKVYEAKSQSFSSSGVFSVPEGVTTVWVSLGGGGGGGGGGMVNQNAIVSPGGGGGAGREIMYKQVSVSGGTTIPVTVGAGGLGGVSGLIVYKGSLSPRGNNGADGGISSFGSFVSAAGGGGGKTGSVLSKYENKPGSGGDIGGQPGKCYDLYEGIDRCLSLIDIWTGGIGTMQYGGAGGGVVGGTGASYTTKVVTSTGGDGTTISENRVDQIFAATDGTSGVSGGGGGGIVNPSVSYPKIPVLPINGGKGGSGYASVYWCDAGLTPVSGSISSGLCQ